MAEHEATPPQEATAQVATAGARHGFEHHSFEPHGSEDSVEQRHRKILVFAHVGRKEARDAARQACTQLYEEGLAPVMTRSDLETLSENWDEPVPVQASTNPWRSSILNSAWCSVATVRFFVPQNGTPNQCSAHRCEPGARRLPRRIRRERPD